MGVATNVDNITRGHTEVLKSRFRCVDEPVASRLGVDYPFPPHLEYAYPPPDGNILTNIVNALIAVPRFYTQVLHLMNKMNIPAPFQLALPTPSLALPHHPPVASKSCGIDVSSVELETESSEEEVNEETSFSGAKIAKSGRKRARHEDIIGPGIDKYVTDEAVGLKRATVLWKEIPRTIKKNSRFQIKCSLKNFDNETDDNIELADPERNVSDLKPYATLKDLDSCRLPSEEILSLPMFKNYTAGSPTSVLYIKNLAKDFISDDFYYIFGSLFGSITAAKSALGVKLMQEGRMRGQAFVTFPSVDCAEEALKRVHGCVFKGKPMIIQFGRNPAAGKPN